jgi:catechol 2,3-dioxygenase-like lactoylglutathione lyase family enzyme
MTSTPTPQPTRCPAPTAKAIELAYLTFQRSDLQLAERFLLDFGLRTEAKSDEAIYMRHTGSSPFCCRLVRGAESRFVGLAFTVPNRAELDALSRVSGASDVEPIPGPGGGERVRLVDPSGFVVEAVSGRSEVESLYRREPLPTNNPGYPARINTPQRPPLAPPAITKLGHVALEVSRFRDTCAWYSQHFGLIPSDVQVLPDGSPAVVFFRLDLGDTPADHHTVAIVQGYKAAFGHCAYEVVDADAVAMGQRVLRECGWRHAWGMGRHILGSQVFDYWSDPWGDKHEHYSDGDLFTSDVPTGVHDASREAMAQWGPPMPRSFTRPELSVENVRALLRSLRESPDLTASKLLQLLATFG